MGIVERYGGAPTEEQMKDYAWEVLNSGRVVPGYGHAVLRATDPRFTAQVAWGKERIPEDPVFQTVAKMFDLVPGILKEQGKAKNPWPNVDAASGSLVYHFGIKEFPFYTVLFSVSRALGHDDDGVTPSFDALPQRSEEPREREGGFRDQTEIHLRVGQRGVGRNEAGIPSHELDQSDAVASSPRLVVSGIGCPSGFRHCCMEPERGLNGRNIIVDCFRYSDNGDLQAPSGNLPGKGVCPAERAVTADGKQNSDFHPFKSVDHIPHILGAPG